MKDSTNCFHCGLSNPSQTYSLTVNGTEQYFCCTGCHSAAKTIIDSGLEQYYQFHQPNEHPVDQTVSEKIRQSLKHFDREDVQAEFVIKAGNGQKECVLLIEGISCSACTWLIEKRLLQLEGMLSAHVNAGTHRLHLRWDSETLKLSEIFVALQWIGYQAHPFLPDEEEKIRLRTQRKFILRIGVAGIGMMQAMMNAVALYSGSIIEQHERWLWLTSLALTLPVILISAWPFFVAALQSIKGRQLTMDVSVSLAILSAFLASVYATVLGHGEVYYESVNMFVFFLVLSRFFEFRARSLAHAKGNAVSSLMPQTCTLETPKGPNEVSIRDIKLGDHINLKPGETAPFDGRVVSGSSKFDESNYTGEFRSVDKNPGSPISAGTTNQHQSIVIEVTKAGADSSYNVLRTLIERAGSEKSRIAELADRGSRQFIWTTLLITIVIGLVWLWVDPDRAFWVVISVLVVTCPCALSLATPTALAQATLNLKQQGFIITRGYALERLAKLKQIAFDKTGTLTEGKFVIQEIRLSSTAKALALCENDVLDIAATLESKSEHPIAQAFTRASDQRDLNLESIKNIPSVGVSGQSDRGKWFLGSDDISLKSPSMATFLKLTLNDEIIAQFTLSDAIRPTASSMFSDLTGQDIHSHILTGDPSEEFSKDFKAIGLSGEYKSGCSPNDKVEWIADKAQLAVVGDGLNDAPLLAKASLSIAMANATDLTKNQADVLMFTSDLQVISKAVNLAQKTQRIIRQNLIWALIYNAIALPVAAAGLVSPWQAAIGMSISSLIVVGNALRLRN